MGETERQTYRQVILLHIYAHRYHKLISTPWKLILSNEKYNLSTTYSFFLWHYNPAERVIPNRVSQFLSRLLQQLLTAFYFQLHTNVPWCACIRVFQIFCLNFEKNPHNTININRQVCELSKASCFYWPLRRNAPVLCFNFHEYITLRSRLHTFSFCDFNIIIFIRIFLNW